VCPLSVTPAACGEHERVQDVSRSSRRRVSGQTGDLCPHERSLAGRVPDKDDVFLRLQKLLEPFGITTFYTDGWGPTSGISILSSTRWAERAHRKSKASISICGRESSG
jgi:hypothetical protein